MSVSESYRMYVLEQLERAGRVSARRMFGGVGLYCEGTFFGLIAEDTLYLKADESSRADFEAAGSRPFQPLGEGSYSMSYYEVPAEILEDRTAVAAWVRKSMAVARKSSTAKKKGT